MFIVPWDGEGTTCKLHLLTDSTVLPLLVVPCSHFLRPFTFMQPLFLCSGIDARCCTLNAPLSMVRMPHIKKAAPLQPNPTNHRG